MKQALDHNWLRRMYIRRARINFIKDIELQRRTRLHDLAGKLGLTVKEVEKIWLEYSIEESKEALNENRGRGFEPDSAR